ELREWSHPPGSIVKINFDGAYDGCHYKLASGIVVRNVEGIVLLSCSKTHKDVASILAAEVLACRDLLGIIKKCQLKSQDRSQVGAYIHDIQQITDGFNNIVFKYTPRSANGLAHILATKYLKNCEEFYLLKNVPGYAEKQKNADWMREPD
ncbi:hypothetical protein Golob_006372, partial [Gossypium lobatum]|nr:hypothetical protein [Gossypium lobatum]